MATGPLMLVSTRFGATACAQVKQTYAEIDAVETELACFEALQQQERAAMPLRVEALQQALQAQTDREAMLQARIAAAVCALSCLCTQH